MKTLFATILVALTLSTSSASFAAAKPIYKSQTETGIPASVTFAQVEKSKLDVIVEKVANAPMSIRLTDATGKTIATKTLSQRESATRVRFDLANLADGVYHVKVKDGQSTQMQKFELKTAEPVLATYKDVAIL